MADVTGWTGKTACALQAALRLSQDSFAAHLGISARTVAAWHKKPNIKPQSEMQQILDATLERAAPSVAARFVELIDATADRHGTDTTEADQRLSDDPHIGAALDWLDRYADWEPGTSRGAVAARLGQLDVRHLFDRGSRRGRVGQRDVARALADYYGDQPLYSARCGEAKISTSILTRPDWLDLYCPLRPANDQLRIAMLPEPTHSLDDHAVGARSRARVARPCSSDLRPIPARPSWSFLTFFHTHSSGFSSGE